MKALATNKLVHHPSYPKILSLYNEMLKRDGKVNNKKFYETIVVPEIPGYSMQSWYFFLKRFKTEVGILAAELDDPVPENVSIEGGIMSDDRAGRHEDKKLAETLLTNSAATARGIQAALNIGAARLQQLMENPQLMSAKDAIHLLFQAMKAQDSRIHAVGKIREDNRSQEKFDRTFSDAAYAQTDGE